MQIKILKEIGLTEGEIKVYLALLKLGSTTSGKITDLAEVSRSKVYHILERLIKKNLVSYIIKEKTKYYQAEDPIKIRQYLDKKEKDFVNQRIEIDKLIPQLQLQKQSAPYAEAQIYKGFKGIQTVHEHSYLKLRKGDVIFYLGIPSYQDEKYHLYWQRDHKKREKAGIIAHSLFNQNTDKKILQNRNKYKNSDARYMPIAIETPAWIMGYKDVTVIGLQGENEIALEITNQKIANSFRAYFDAFWQITKPFE